MSQTKAALERLDKLEAEAKEIRKILVSSKPQNIIDRVKTFEDALEVYREIHGEPSNSMNTILSYSGTDPEMIALQGIAQVNIIRAALNEGWTPAWTKSSEAKYYPWFDMSSGSGLACGDFGRVGSGSGVGSRLCFKSRELAEYAGKQFISIYEKFMTI